MLTRFARVNRIPSGGFTKTVVSFKSTDTKGYQKSQYDAQEAMNVKPAGWDEAKPFEAIPGPKPLPLVGNIWRLLIGDLAKKDLFEIHKIIHAKYGRIASYRNMINGYNWVFLFDSEDCETIFRNEGLWPRRDGLDTFTHYRKEVRPEWFGDITGLATEHGENWYKFRTTVNPILMQPRVTVQYVKNMDIVAEEFIDIVRRLSKEDPQHQMPESFDNELNKWALESIGLIAIDRRLGCLKPEPNPEAQMIIKNVIEMFDLVYKLDLGPSPWRYIRTKTYKRFIEVQDFLSTTIRRYLDEAYEKIQNAKEEKPLSEQSALEKLLKIDKHFAFVMANDMIVAGIDTTSKATGATLYYLAKNPKAQETLREELIRLLPTKNTPITKEILEEASYLKAAIKESMRFAPIATGNVRTSQKDLVIAGYQVPKGCLLLSSNLLMSMNDFPRGNEFLPERWLRQTTGELSHKNVNPFTSLPFGFGPRSCVGKRLANLEIETLVAKVVRNFRLEWHHPDMKFKQSLLYGFVDPLKLTVLETNN